MAKSRTVYRAKRTFWRGNHYISEGKDYKSDHPVVQAAPGSFDKIRVETSDDPPVERGTAAPGEKRETK